MDIKSKPNKKASSLLAYSLLTASMAFSAGYCGSAYINVPKNIIIEDLNNDGIPEVIVQYRTGKSEVFLRKENSLLEKLENPTPEQTKRIEEIVKQYK
ncbi:MAG TPA: hypothetical protein VI564_09540 [Candidatus Nanoarchaeia archaeon]|nr:hypothetical protein [Candidatus Nanoarchaeia archaeon]